jgi:hypothetical protein
VRKSFPLPDVIYPRERAYAVNHNYRKRLEKIGVRFFNPPLVDKWGTHQIMKKNSDMAKNLRETHFSETSINGHDGQKIPFCLIKADHRGQRQNIIKSDKKKEFIQL